MLVLATEARHRFALDAAARQESTAVSTAVHEALEEQRVKFAEEMQMTLDAAETTHRAALTQATNKWVERYRVLCMRVPRSACQSVCVRRHMFIPAKHACYCWTHAVACTMAPPSLLSVLNNTCLHVDFCACVHLCCYAVPIACLGRLCIARMRRY
jgi:hypothetical protein